MSRNFAEVSRALRRIEDRLDRSKGPGGDCEDGPVPQHQNCPTVQQAKVAEGKRKSERIGKAQSSVASSKASRPIARPEDRAL